MSREDKNKQVQCYKIKVTGRFLKAGNEQYKCLKQLIEFFNMDTIGDLDTNKFSGVALMIKVRLQWINEKIEHIFSI